MLPESTPRAGEMPLARGVIRTVPEDFLVEEIMPVTPSGEGEHLWLKVRKRDHNTRDVAAALAKRARVRSRDVGYAGLKDRRAVTIQWFSIWLPGSGSPGFSDLPAGMEVLEAHRHSRKLRRGAGRGNRFRLLLREVGGDWDATRRCLEQIGRYGVPNYFGEQRFGIGFANLDWARALFRAGRPPRRGSLDGIYISAARSWVFNEVLAERVRRRIWDQAVEGDLMSLDGSERWFRPPGPGDPVIGQRLGALDIHPSGPLWGRGPPPVGGRTSELEQAVADRHPDLCRGLERVGLDQERRALRLSVRGLRWELRHESSQVCLEFALSSGGYATAVLRELIVTPSA